MKTIKNLIFDFGGVLVDISRATAVARFKEIGIDKAELLLGEYKQEGLLLDLEEGRIDRSAFYDELRAYAQKEISDAQIDYAWFGFMLPLVQARFDFLLELRKHYHVYLLSNTNPIIMSWAQSEQFSSANKPLDFYFDKLFLSYKMGVAKPDPKIFKLMIEDLQQDPQSCLFLDDGASNIEIASQLGFQTHLIKPNEDYRNLPLFKKLS